MYLGDPLSTLRIGDRTVKVVDPWRTGLLSACIPGYAIYWWYRTAAELQAFGREARDDNSRLNPILMLILVLFSGAIVPLIAAVALLSEATKAAQGHEQLHRRASTARNVAVLLLSWLVGPIAIVTAAAIGASAGALLLAAIGGMLFSLALTVVLYEQLQHDLNRVWAARRLQVEAGLLVV